MKRYLGPIILLVAAIVIGIVGIVVAVSNFAGLATTFADGTWTAPGTHSIELQPGEYAISHQIGSSLGTGGNAPSYENVTVSDPAGKTVAVRCGNCGGTSEDVTLGNTKYVAFAKFDAHDSGKYKIDVRDSSGLVAITPSVATIISSSVPAFVGIGLAVLLGIGALVWLLIAIFTRKKVAPVAAGGPAVAAPVYPTQQQQPQAWGQTPDAQTPDQPAAGTQPQPATAGQPAQPQTPPGWYPDPNNASQQRWWDGQKWTDQVFGG